MYLYKQTFEKMLRSWGYCGIYVDTSIRKAVEESGVVISLVTSFWKGKHQIQFDVRCTARELTDDILRNFIEIMMFADIERVKNISSNDDIEELMRNYLAEDKSFSDVQDKGRSFPHISAFRNGVEYRVYISMRSKEPKLFDVLDGYGEDYDEVMAFNKEEMEKLLGEEGMSRYELEISPDFTTVKISIRYKQKIHHLEIHAYYDSYFYLWSVDAVLVCGCYWEMLTLGENHMVRFTEAMLEKKFFEISSPQYDGKSILMFAYRFTNKYRISILVENDQFSFDNMDGHEFERFCADVLMKNGFEEIRVTRGSGDQGVDIIAYKDDVKYGIQCKCHSSDIGNRAVQEVFAGKTYYQCHVGVVLTNRYFTKAAIELAKRNGIVLWDRDRLLKMVELYHVN